MGGVTPQLSHTFKIPAWKRLLHEVETVGLEGPDATWRACPVPALIGVHAQRHRGADDLSDPLDPLEVVGKGMRCGLDLEDALSPRAQLGCLRHLVLEFRDRE